MGIGARSIHSPERNTTVRMWAHSRRGTPMKDTWGDVDTGGASLQESEHHTKERRTHTRIGRHQNEHKPRRSCEMNTWAG